MSKRILLTVTNDLSYDQRMHRICMSLHQNGYQVLLVGRQKTDSIRLSEKPYKQKRLYCYFQKGKAFYLEYNIRLLLFLFQQSFDLLYAVDLDTILPALACKYLKNCRTIYDAHEYFSEVPEVVNRPFTKKVWESVARLAIPRMDICLTVGPALAQVFTQRYKRPFQVVRNVPYRKQQKFSQAKHHPPVILYQGMLNEGRGLEAMIQTMPQLPNWKLWLIGEGDLSDSLRAMVQQLQLQEQVQFLGFIPPDDLPQYTQQATLGINLLENKGLSYYYSLANKALDYMQAGLPSLQMNFPEYEALQAQYEPFVLVPDLAPITLQKAIQQLGEDQELYERLANNCLQAAEELCWEAEEEVFLGMLNAEC